MYLLPCCDDILESLAGAQWFSHLDLLRAYWQIDVAEEDQEKTAFATPDLPILQVKFWPYKCTSMFHEGYASCLERFMLVRLSSASR